MKPIPPRDTPRCKRCGVRLPLHVAGCPELPPTKKTEPSGLDAVTPPPYEVTQRSRFTDSGHVDCDCMDCRPWTS